MRKSLICVLALTTVLACKDDQNKSENEDVTMILSYPETKKVDTVDTYFETPVQDLYRWLEDDYAEDTKAWVKAQNEVTFDYLNQIPFRSKLK
tara:strand:+ start:689 stop:967 length:279 start_codon:yes stop_codon:yes gene_type:complete